MRRSIWDVYLDATDARVVLDAAATLERGRVVREPLPLDDAARLLERLRTIARLGGEDAVHWAREAEDRRDEATVDGGRFGDRDVAGEMARIADDLAVGWGRIAAVADDAARDLAVRLGDGPSTAAVDAADAAAEEVRRQLDRDR